MPAPGTIRTLNFPSGPGVRVDAGVAEGDTVSGNFDSMIAKIIVTGATRDEAIQRARRALAELEIEGIPTVVPFHRAVLEAPEFTAPNGDFRVYTTWIETEFADTIAALTTSGPVTEAIEEEATERVIVEVGGKRLEVVLPAALAQAGRARSGMPVRRTARRAGGPTRAASGASLTSPMQGTIVKVAVADGADVAEGDLIVVLEAMKMEQPLTAHKSGIVTGLTLAVGAGVSAGTVICEIADVKRPRNNARRDLRKRVSRP